jgi:hypothetical protein
MSLFLRISDVDLVNTARRSFPRVVRDIGVAYTEPRYWRRRYWSQGVVFICGCGHSGTTLMLRVLGAHPSVYATSMETGLFLRQPLSWPQFRELRREVERSGRGFLVEKTPRHIRHLQLMRRTVPGAKFLIMVRDGRDVTASIGHRNGGCFSDGLDRWIADNRIAVAEACADDVLIIRYEDLIENFERTISRACRFIGFNPDGTLIEYHRVPFTWNGCDGTVKGDGRSEAGHIQLRAWQINQPVFDGRGRWKKELPPEVALAFSRPEAADILRYFHYI